MRVRTMDSDNDMTFGRGGQNFLVNNPAAVAQCVGTRMRLWQGEWFLDTAEGTPWLQQVVGRNTGGFYDQVLMARMLGSPGVLSIVSYQSQLDRTTRALTFSSRLETLFSADQAISITL